MNTVNFHGIKEKWHLLKWMGVNHPLLALTPNTLIATWIVIGCLFATLLFAKIFFHKKDGVVRFMTLSTVSAFMNLNRQTLGFFDYRHFSFMTTLFLFILYCNLASLIPFVEEPTADLNTTLALGIISFLYVNIHAIKHHGLKGYVAEYFRPFVVMFPLHVVGKLASIISISFRLFGNLLGGSVITKLFLSMVGTAPSAWYFYFVPILGSLISLIFFGFFSVFEGAVQAFIFMMLSLTYLSSALSDEG